MSGIYLHIPFCKQACTYCDFHFSTLLAGKAELVKAMLSELELQKNYLPSKQINSIYFGGGTPSLLTQAELSSLMEKIKQHFVINTKAEMTLEANPDDITQTRLKEWKNAGINRLSIGLQSFNDEELRWMNRAHNAQESLSSVYLAQDAGFDNITIDLIYGSKFQSLETWENTLEKAISLNTQHISSYNLTIEDKTALGVNFKKGKEPNVNEDLSASQFDLMQQKLKAAGFIHYEISNFAKEGFFAKHNSNYWLQEPYLGIGPSAHSYNGVSRQWNVKNNPIYVNHLKNNTPFFELEELTSDNRYNEYVLTRLRTVWGCDADQIKTLFGDSYKIHFLNALGERSAHFEKRGEVYVLKEESKFLADGLAADLFV